MTGLDRTKEDLIEAITKSIPAPQQITDWDLSESKAVRFTWRGDRFRVSDSIFVEQCDRSCLIASNIAWLLETAIRKHIGLGERK